MDRRALKDRLAARLDDEAARRSRVVPDDPTAARRRVDKWRLAESLLPCTPFTDATLGPGSRQWREAAVKVRDIVPRRDPVDHAPEQAAIAANLERGTCRSAQAAMEERSPRKELGA